MLCNESQDKFGKNDECMLSGCDDTRHDGTSTHSLSHNTTRGATKAELVTEKEDNTENIQTKEKQDMPITEEVEQDGHYTLSSGCKVQSDGRGAASQQHNSNNEQSSHANITNTVLAKNSRSKTESTTGTHDRPAFTFQVVVVLLMAWTVMASCTGMTFPGVVLPQFTNPDTDDLYLESNILSLFVSLPHAGTMVGSLLTGQLLAPLGARLTILIGLPLGIAAWLGLTFSSQLWILMTCRVFMGFTFAFVKPSAIMYIIEIAHESLRGRLVGVLSISKEVGYFSSYILGGLRLTWRQLSLVYACILVPPTIGVFLLPNSPRWLTTHGHIDEARKSLVFYRGRHCDVETELGDMVRQADEAGSRTTTWQQLKLLARPATLRMFLLVLTLFVVYPLHGSAMLSPYLMIILDTPGAPLNPSLGSLLCSIFKISGGIAHFIFIDYFGRVPILVVTLCFTSVCTFAYGYYFYIFDPTNIDSATWIPLASVVILNFLGGMNGPVIDILQGELLPNACRAASIPIITLINGLTVFGVVSLFPYMMEVMGMPGLFGFFTTVSFALALLCVLALPETRGLSLEAISDAVHSTKQKVVKQTDDVNQ